MQRWVTGAVGLAIVALAVCVVARGFPAPKAIGRDPSGGNDAGWDDGGGLLYAYADAGPADKGPPLLVGDLADLSAVSQPGDGGTGSFLLDGTPVPPLPLDAARQVRFGVVLVAYAGAQPSLGGGRPASRSRAEAKELAAKLYATAGKDFHAAVQQGDPGSSDDVGRVKAGILEPAPEYVLFTLPVDAVGGRSTHRGDIGSSRDSNEGME